MQRMVIVGGGPAGLFLARLVRMRKPGCEVRVFERDPAETTYGFGVVFSPPTLSRLARADRVTHDQIVDASVQWPSMEMHHRGTGVSWRGFGFAGIARATLLQVLQDQASAVGAELNFRTEITPDDLEEFSRADVIAVCEGVNSRLRDAHADVFKPTIQFAESKYIWLGSGVPWPHGTFHFTENEHGAFAIHGYPYSEDMSTVVVEADEETWQRAGLDQPTNDLSVPGSSDENSITYLSDLFHDELMGHELIGNRSVWENYRTLRNNDWHHGNLVLLGDAAHTASPSVGSGTKMAMEDAIALSESLDDETDLAAAFESYERQRRPEVERIQARSVPSQEWWSTFRRRLYRSPENLAFHFLTRTGAVTHRTMEDKDPAFMEVVRREFEQNVGKQTGTDTDGRAAKVPLDSPLRLRDVILPARVALSLPVDGPIDRLDELIRSIGARLASKVGLLLLDATKSDPLERMDRDDLRSSIEHVRSIADCPVAIRVTLRPDSLHGAVSLLEDLDIEVLMLQIPGRRPDPPSAHLRLLEGVRTIWPSSRPLGLTFELPQDGDRLHEWRRFISAAGCDLFVGMPSRPDRPGSLGLRDLPPGVRDIDWIRDAVPGMGGVLLDAHATTESIEVSILSRRVDVVELSPQVASSPQGSASQP